MYPRLILFCLPSFLLAVVAHTCSTYTFLLLLLLLPPFLLLLLLGSLVLSAVRCMVRGYRATERNDNLLLCVATTAAALVLSTNRLTSIVSAQKHHRQENVAPVACDSLVCNRDVALYHSPEHLLTSHFSSSISPLTGRRRGP